MGGSIGGQGVGKRERHLDTCIQLISYLAKLPFINKAPASKSFNWPARRWNKNV